MDLEPMESGHAVDQYIRDKQHDESKATIRKNRSRLSRFVEWYEQEGLDNLNDLTSRHSMDFKLWRREEGGLAEYTLYQNLCTLRVFLKWCVSYNAVVPELPEIMDILYDSIAAINSST